MNSQRPLSTRTLRSSHNAPLRWHWRTLQADQSRITSLEIVRPVLADADIGPQDNPLVKP